MDTVPPAGQTVLSAPDSTALSFYNLLLLVPHLHVTSIGEVDYAAADPALLVQVADAADASLLIVHIGVSAIGRLSAQAETAPFSDARSVDAIEALGWLVAELNDFAGAVHRISTGCRRHTYDCKPNTLTTIPLVRP